MTSRNMSDIIEGYLKEILEVEEQIEIRRSEMADLFNCVPSQINYVINTRFTVPKGYKVESKRGGGGYIRIYKVNLVQHSDYLYHFSEEVSSELTESEGFAILEQLYENKLITKREKNLITGLLSTKAMLSIEENNLLRAQMISDLLERLAYEEKE
ncbi:MAG: CtsR family transcriptional regulator [Vagococcus sp.]